MEASGFGGGLVAGMFAITAWAAVMTIAAVWLLKDLLRLKAAGNVLPGGIDAPAGAAAPKAVEAKSRFLATVSHEMRTPLNGIMGMADLLADMNMTPEQMTYVRAVKSSGQALLSLIDEILDFSKLEAGKIDLVEEPFNLHALAEGAVELMAPRAQDKSIEIALFIAPDVPGTMRGDAARLRQVLLNLAGNAIKFTERGGVGVTVSMAGSGSLKIAVLDTGIGVAEDKLGAIFGEFEQADDSASRRHEGTGLGLTISKRIVMLMGGSISVKSELGKGSQFSVTLPFLGSEAAAIGTPSHAAFVLHHFLIAGDSPFEAPFLARSIRSLGGTASLARTDDEAVAAIKSGQITDVIVDAALGSDAARAIAAAALAGGVGQRVIMLSPFERRSFGPPAAAGFAGYLIKPVRMRSFMARFLDDPSSMPADLPEQISDVSRLPSGLNVLFAEDNEINALLVLKLFEKAGCHVTWVKDGVSAYAAAEAALRGERQRFDLLLLDIRMPGMDGLEVSMRTRAAERLFGAPPAQIVALTANAFDEDRAAARAAGVDSFISKPLDAARLALALKSDQARAA